MCCAYRTCYFYTFVLFGRLGNMFHDHALNALPDHCRGGGHQTQLFPALGHLLLHLLVVGRAARTLDQLTAKTVITNTVEKKQLWVCLDKSPLTR